VLKNQTLSSSKGWCTHDLAMYVD